ncbi:MAG: response regulator, partial [Muribaculaceae bacterium]|nr:response regulator [Muribaculaceae bacterium]
PQPVAPAPAPQPAAPAPAPQSAAPSPAPAQANVPARLRLLVAEDNESNYLLFESVLEAHYELCHAWDGNEAVEMFNAFQPDMIIMDINMPNKDGYEATREIRQYSSTVPIIAVTAYAFASDRERILRSGFNSYVSKPINPMRLLQELKRVLATTGY